MVSNELDSKLAELREYLRGLGRVIIAYSGGVDSAFLLKVAHEELGEKAQAVIGISPSLLEEELVEAREVAAKIGVPLREVETHEIDDENYAANPVNRCYFCKSELFNVLTRLAEAEGFDAVCDGTNLDDMQEWRPGAQAGAERAIRSPLREVKLSKAEIRQLSQGLGLPTWDKPAMPCLSSRIPYGQPVTAQALRMIGRAEVYLRERGLREVRVRHYTENGRSQARLEIPPDELPKIFEFYTEATAKLREIGYESILLDLEGYRRGKMNEAAKVGPQNIQLILN